ncbi:flagellar type III secretion system pore protein FliP [Liquorilactobacillus vini]|uniref:Flagellar biosynthetic protein FliP n=1 Tax=Liquorilactobacillus vini DSM 20605 TaxID=1133569 RepID=A0A0A7RGU5_9LACO|nr:flagellar type III secretion system pore protein FliP [Liquorilactobacillus vini]AJA34492.1 flagellar biosynthetic protein FliP [Liquorilactobacillus vini DSM 20605]KRM88637.1 flagellar biosynthesis protein FliP [Liquorilactobacillus vini DSM 20605]
MKRKAFLPLAAGLATLIFTLNTATPVLAISAKNLSSTVNNLLGSNGSSSQIINTFLMLTILSFIPLLLVMTTSFTRIIMVLSFTRSALGTQSNPPNQVLIGLALFLTFFIMRPTYSNIYQQAVVPYEQQKITRTQAIDRSEISVKKFMYRQTRQKDIQLFVSQSDHPKAQYKSYKQIPLTIITPAFILSELRTAFSIGFLIFIPFLIIDMVVSSVLMSMGMVMLPPVMISLPFKLLLFVLSDGWYLLVESLIKSFNG